MALAEIVRCRSYSVHDDFRKSLLWNFFPGEPSDNSIRFGLRECDGRIKHFLPLCLCPQVIDYLLCVHYDGRPNWKCIPENGR